MVPILRLCSRKLYRQDFDLLENLLDLHLLLLYSLLFFLAELNIKNCLFKDVVKLEIFFYALSFEVALQVKEFGVGFGTFSEHVGTKGFAKVSVFLVKRHEDEQTGN